MGSRSATVLASLVRVVCFFLDYQTARLSCLILSSCVSKKKIGSCSYFEYFSNLLEQVMKPDVHSAMPPPIEYKRKAEHRLEGNGMPKGENFSFAAFFFFLVFANEQLLQRLEITRPRGRTESRTMRN